MSRRSDERGAAAVEFAIVSMLLFMILFGIVQYGYAFFQIQGAQSVAGQAARLASLGISNCSDSGNPLASTPPTNFVGSVLVAADRAGLGGSRITAVDLSWGDPPGAVAVRGGNLLVKITYVPLRLGVALVPFPSGDFTATAQARVEDLGIDKFPCTWTRP